MDVILHLGAHRTGTTTLQTYLVRHRAALLAQGLLALGPSVLRSGSFDTLSGLHRPQGELAQAQRLLNHDLDVAASAGLRAVLLSEENLIGQPRQMLVSGALYPDLVAHLRRLGPQMRGRVTRVGLAVRSYDRYWASLAAFGIQQGVYRPQAGHAQLWHDAALSGLHGWPVHVAALARLFPRAGILVWRAESEANRPARVLAHLDRGLRDLPAEAPHMNASPACRDLREKLAGIGAYKAAALVGEGARYMPFTDRQARAMAALYLDDLARIAAMGGRVRLLSRAPGRNDKDHGPGAGALPPAARKGGERDVPIRWQNH